jgi:P2 family phage contractile tail tube protein
MGLPIRKLSNANVYIDGSNFFGTVKEVTLPEGAAKMVEYMALGMQGSIDLPVGFEKMSAKFVWTSFHEEAIKATADIYKGLKMQIRANLEEYSSAGLIGEKAFVCSINGTSTNMPAGSFKAQENMEVETNFNVTYIKVTIGGKDVYEFDPVLNIYKVNGVDRLSNFRNNIGQ